MFTLRVIEGSLIEANSKQIWTGASLRKSAQHRSGRAGHNPDSVVTRSAIGGRIHGLPHRLTVGAKPSGWRTAPLHENCAQLEACRCEIHE